MPKTSNSSQGPINEETTKKIKELLQKNPMGLSVTQVATNLNLGRNTVAKYLDLLTTAGILDRREVGKAKIYNVSHRIPTSAVMELSTDSIFIVNSEKKLIQLNSAFEELTKCDKTELINKKFSDIDSVNKCISKLEAHISKAIFGKEWKGIIECHKDNELKYFKSRTIPTTLETGEKAATIFMENITEEIKIKQAIKSKLEFEEVIMSLLKEVMSSPVTKLDKVVNEGLKKVGEFSKVDRTYIFSFDKEKNDSSNIYEWCSKGIAPQIKSLKNIPNKTSPWFTKTILSKGTIHIKDIDKMPKNARADQEILKMQKIKSLIAVPMILNNEVKGFVGFDSVKDYKIWDEEIIKLLNVVALIFSSILQRLNKI